MLKRECEQLYPHFFLMFAGGTWKDEELIGRSDGRIDRRYVSKNLISSYITSEFHARKV